jgi:hypothetical protein
MRVRWLASCFAIIGAFAVGEACGGPQKLGGAGDGCFRAADCQEGLVCIQFVCSSDLAKIGGDVKPPDMATGGTPGGAGAPGNAGAPPAGGAPSGGAPASGGASSGGASSGGASSGGASTGGSATGGSASGGASTGGSATGGTNLGGAPI